MAPKAGGNTKKESGRAKKAENEAKKKDAAAAEKEKQEADKWNDGGKSSKASKEEKEEKRKAELARKAENARLLAEEEASESAKAKAAPKAGAKKGKNPKPAGPGAMAADGTSGDSNDKDGFAKEIESYSATGIDNALDLLDVVTAKMDKASIGQQAAGLEKHPERRFKAAYEAYKEKELPKFKEDHPGLRLQQYQDLMYKNFQKSPDNPFNQGVLSYDATKEEKVEALKTKKTEIEDRLREKA
jgi:hypothetical protein